MRKKQLIERKPAYYRGQLLLEDDFIAEQKFHTHARYRHSLDLHGWGVVRGLEVTRADDSAVSISTGFAIDGRGHEIDIRQSEILTLSALGPSALASITLRYEAEKPNAWQEQEARIDCYGVLSASTGVEEAAIVLATVQLDAYGKLMPDSISNANRRQLRTPLAPGSVTVAALDAGLRRGWLRLPFRPMPIPPSKAEPDPPPPFRVGPTEAKSHSQYNGQPNTRGAAGTMAIPLPPAVTRVCRLRVAGEANDKTMALKLWTGGWNAAEHKHVVRELLKDEITGGPYDKTYEIAEGGLHAEWSTLSLEIRSAGYTKVSLVAVEVLYW